MINHVSIYPVISLMVIAHYNGVKSESEAPSEIPAPGLLRLNSNVNELVDPPNAVSENNDIPTHAPTVAPKPATVPSNPSPTTKDEPTKLSSTTSNVTTAPPTQKANVVTPATATATPSPIKISDSIPESTPATLESTAVNTTNATPTVVATITLPPTTAPKPTTATPVPSTSSIPVSAPSAVPRPTSNIQTDLSTTNVLPLSPSGVNPTMFVGFSILCLFFLVLWSRRRRQNIPTGEDSVAMMSEMTTSSSCDTKKNKVTASTTQYSRIDGENNDDEEYGEGGNWDDWEGASGNQQELNPTSALVGKGTRLHEITLSSPPKSSSVGSNVSDSLIDLHPSPSIQPPGSPPKASNATQGDISNEVDDLFSQFGMVPTFKKGGQQPVTSTTINMTDDLFAATGDGDEWGEDDDWVQKI